MQPNNFQGKRNEKKNENYKEKTQNSKKQRIEKERRR